MRTLCSLIVCDFILCVCEMDGGNNMCSIIVFWNVDFMGSVWDGGSVVCSECDVL